MLDIKSSKDYVKELSLKYGLPKKIIQKLLTYGLKNICQMIKEGEDIQLQHFGSIYFNKKAYLNFLKSKKLKNGTNNYGPGTVRKREEFLIKKLASKIHIDSKS